MSRQDSLKEYKNALRQGQRYYQEHVSQGQYPYMQVLEELIDGKSSAGSLPVGTVEIPMERIVGTLAKGRNKAFAGNFMPMLDPTSEFAGKWINLYEAHMEKGISDPIVVIEYMGLFYVQEGHKRVSVMRYLGAPSMLATVSRLLPAWDDTPAVRAAYEFVQFYKLSGTYRLYCNVPGSYARLQKAMGLAPDQVWTDEDRMTFHSTYWKFDMAYRKAVPDSANRVMSRSDALMIYLGLYDYHEILTLSDEVLQKRLAALQQQFLFLHNDGPTAVSTEPEAAAEKSVINKLLDGLSHPVLRVAFIYASNPSASSWSGGHRSGQEYLERRMEGKVQVSSYLVSDGDADAVMEQAAQEGAQLVIVTAPTLLQSARRLAASHSGLKVLVCALSVPVAGVRTYYSRMYEAKFITGALAGSLWTGGTIGYIARYPILGEPASINAFALGVRMTAPNAPVHLAWSSLPGDPWQELLRQRARIISRFETTVRHSGSAVETVPMSTVMMEPGGSFVPVASACWDWGRQYVQLVQIVLSGAWDAYRQENAISYWWGMDSGVIDVRIADNVPAGPRQLANLLRQNLKDGTLQPFHTEIRDQEGCLRNDGTQFFSPEELMKMNWLCENVTGRIPALEELLPMSQETTRVLALPPQ